MSYESQSSGIVDHALLQNAYQGMQGNGFTSGGVCTATGSNRVITFTDIEGYALGVRFQKSSATVTLDAGDGSQPRMDMIVWDQSAANVIIVKGVATTETATQTKPPLGTLVKGDLIMAVIYMPAGVTVTLDANVYDRRVEPATQKGSDITAASTLTLTDGLSFDVTGATGITAIAQAVEGRLLRLQFDSTPTLTHNGTSLILTGAENFTAAAGDVLWFEALASGNWREVMRHLAAAAAGGRPPIFNQVFGVR